MSDTDRPPDAPSDHAPLETTQDVERLRAAWKAATDHIRETARETQAKWLLAPTPPAPLSPHPGEGHDYRMRCLRCGEPGSLFVGFHSPGETFRFHPKETDRG